MNIVLQGKKLCSNDELRQRTDNERRRIKARKQDSAALNTFAVARARGRSAREAINVIAPHPDDTAIDAEAIFISQLRLFRRRVIRRLAQWDPDPLNAREVSFYEDVERSLTEALREGAAV